MIYYKMTYQNGDVEAKKVEDIDKFLDEKNEWSGVAEIEEISESEYHNLNLDNNPKINVFYTSEVEEPSIDEIVDEVTARSIRLNILSFFTDREELPKINDLDMYYEWVMKK